MSLDFVYDSNVNYGSLDDTYEISVGTVLAQAEQDDSALQLYGDIVNIYDIGSKNGFAIKNRIKLFLKEYKELNDYDIGYVAYIPSLIYRETRYLSELALEFDILKLGSLNYLKTYSIMPRFEYSHTNMLRSIAHFKYKKKSFIQDVQADLDATHLELSYSLQSILSPRSYIQANIIAIVESKDRGTRVDVDYDEYRLNVVYANQFSAVYAVELFGEYKNRAYDDYSSLFNSTREDESGNVSANINAKILKTLRVHFKAGYNRAESNQERYSYQKYTLTIGLNKTF